MKKTDFHRSWILYFLLLALSTFLLPSCRKALPPTEENYIKGIEQERAEKDKAFNTDADSPFNSAPSVKFSPLHYFPVDPEFVFHGKLVKYDKQDSVSTTGTKGDKRTVLRYGYIPFQFRGNSYKVNVYSGRNKAGVDYAVIWFTDRTTGKETYGVGRYLDFEISSDASTVYTVDFNKAYNPYCAYSFRYSCSIPLKEDYLDFEITAGEKSFHN